VLPVSVKGVLLTDGAVILLQNEREEWELPGGRIDPDDASPRAALRRECAEELGIEVTVGAWIDTWVYEPLPGRRIRIQTYECTTSDAVELISVSDEHSAVTVAPLPLADDLALPAGYRRSIERATKQAHRSTGGRTSS
jgi:8-oxo-dGTP pyrophosphatase MutT (NUDIX family)